ncbi:Ubiquitin carboxyl-terminal hydrolase 35 [Mortierella antarctica]|nr:Ubiquitin carboxyl-terminal hydrolase 35 [Mortierella antarctica]
METIIKGVLAKSTLQDNDKSKFIAQLLKRTAGLDKADAAVLLDLALELKLTRRSLLETQTADRIFLAVSIAHRDVFWAKFHSGWLETITSATTTHHDFIRNIPLIIAVVKRKQALTDDEKQEIGRNMEILQQFGETRCITADEPLEYAIQCLFIFMYTGLPDTRPLAMASYIEAVPDVHTSVVDPFVQNLDAAVLWRLEFTVQRLINWLVTTDMAGISVWIVAIMDSLASRGEFALLRKLADENAYKIARQLAFRSRRNDAFLVLKFLLIGYHHSPILFHNISKDLVPLLVSCRKSPDDRAFATDVCNLAQTLVIHFGDSDDVGTRVQKARMFLDLPAVTRAEALQTMQDYSWKRGLQIQGTTAGSKRKPAFVQPLGKVGLVNLGNSCFMNSALRALFCSSDLRQAVLVDIITADPKKIMTLRLRDTFIGLSTSRLSIFTPLMLYKALPEWLNDGHQQDAAEFTQILFSHMEDEDPASKRALSSFHGAIINQIKCSVCETVSSNKEDFYHLTIPLPRSESADIQDVVDIFPSIEDLNDENSNKYFCDECGVLQNAKRFTMLGSLPQNLILSLNRFEFDVKRSQRMKISTPIVLREMIHIKVQDSHETQGYQLYAVVIHTGESAHHGHYYTYARDDDTLAAGTQGLDPASSTTWLLYNDTSITVSSFDAMQQKLANSRTDTPYMLFFRRTDTAPIQQKSNADLSKMTVCNL